mmetsp:Transcript_8288/g.24394  ORF Transcript_8288/g.24394 Transcript_8288/m.24394 type:complete len:292 (-) Transcript_8288:55-930(-)
MCGMCLTNGTEAELGSDAAAGEAPGELVAPCSMSASRSQSSRLSSAKQRSRVCVSSTAKGALSMMSRTSLSSSASRQCGEESPGEESAVAPRAGSMHDRSDAVPCAPSTITRVREMSAVKLSRVRCAERGTDPVVARTALSTAERRCSRPGPRTRWSPADRRRSCVAVGSPIARSFPSAPRPNAAPSELCPSRESGPASPAPARSSIRWRATRLASTRMSRCVSTRAYTETMVCTSAPIFSASHASRLRTLSAAPRASAWSASTSVSARTRERRLETCAQTASSQLACVSS